MNNFREVNEDILKEWLMFREETAFCEMSPQDKKYCIYFEEISERILKNVPNNNKKYVQKQLDQLDKNFMDYYITGTKNTTEMDLLMILSLLWDVLKNNYISTMHF